jgi:hypothetical protein
VVTLMFGLCVAEQMRPGPGPDLTPA